MDHVAIPFMPADIWFYMPSNPQDIIPGIFNFIVLNSSFIMVIFFFISGYFLPSSFERNCMTGFLKKKIVRLLIPVIGGALIFKLLFGRFEIFQLWYLEILFILSVIYAFIKRYIYNSECKKDTEVPSISSVWCLCFAVGICTYIISRYSWYYNYRRVFKVLLIEPIHYPQYISMFILGLVSYRCGWVEKLPNKKGIIFLTLGMILGAGIFLTNGLYFSKWFTIYESFLSINLGIGLIWFFREYVNYKSKFFQWCSKQTLGAYIFHAFIMYGYELVFDSILMNAYAKYFCVGLLTVVTSFMFTYLIRKIPIVAKVI